MIHIHTDVTCTLHGRDITHKGKHTVGHINRGDIRTEGAYTQRDKTTGRHTHNNQGDINTAYHIITRKNLCTNGATYTWRIHT